jgi:hypothetical protein
VKNRETVAVVIAILAIVIGAAYSAWQGLNHSIPLYVSGVWALLAVWVDPPLLGHKRLGEIYQEAKERRLPAHTPMFKTLFVGMVALAALGITLWIKTGR